MFDEKIVEKIFRLFDILQKISSVKYTKRRLSLYGGTALNFLHFQDIPRLSLDIDFNYRDQKEEDWGLERDKIDDIIKKVLSDLNYDDEDIKIQATHPLTRFTAHYRTSKGVKDSIKIEIGYMRRIPIFENDELKTIAHPDTGESIELKTPESEEIFGNKFCTLLYRHKDDTVISSRDLYDVYKISNQKFDKEKFLTALVIDSLMHPEPRIYEKNIRKMMKNLSIDQQLLNLIVDRPIPDDIKKVTRSFIKEYITISKNRYKGLIDTFFDKRDFDPEIFENSDLLNPSIKEHPAILWNLQQLEKKKD